MYVDTDINTKLLSPGALLAVVEPGPHDRLTLGQIWAKAQKKSYIDFTQAVKSIEALLADAVMLH